MDDEISYAISIGEGTLLAYGTSILDDMPVDVDGIHDELEANKDRFLIIIGPADGTGQ